MEALAAAVITAGVSYGASRLTAGGGNAQTAAIRKAQANQQELLTKQKAETDAKESALRRLFSGGAGVSLASGGAGATVLGG